MTTRVPVSTYRLQVSPDFDLAAATAVLPYLHDLGVDWVYLSPLLEAEPGSAHGYDVVAHDQVDAARGGAEGLAALSTEARRLGLGVLVDIVPNHVGVATPLHNAWWWDLLEKGRDSEFASAFDVDWELGGGKIRLPVLADGGLEELAMELPADDTHYEPVHWKVADHGLNYRRFFAVNTLAGLRVEDPSVFDATHVEIRRWFAEQLVDGLRVDHPDGLQDPGAYLRDLSVLTGEGYVLVEKILEPGEHLPASWATAGTTGYDALAMVDRVLTDPAGADRLPFADLDWHAMIHGTKRAVADGILGSETRRIVRDLSPERTEDDELVDAVAELLACFPVYRSYLPEGREHLDAAFATARTARPDLAEVFDRLEPVLHDPAQPAALRFQQTSGMVMAKGVEDCAFYRYPHLTSLTEVGGDPSEFSLSVAGFHEAMAARQRDWPHAMTCTTTHDTKRGEDVRARIAVLAEVPEVWASALDRLQTLAPVPDPPFGSLLWQAVLGAWDGDDPDLRPRLHAYAEKAMREAGDRTTWTAPDEAYEREVHAAVDAAFDSTEVRAVLDELLAVVAGPGRSNALAAKLLALAVPGVPDVYQGSELWEQSLVDPDNRRPVDFDLRRSVLDGDRDHPAAAKLRLVRELLRLRRDRRELFSGYTPVSASGPSSEHVLALDRGGVVAVATRLPVGLAGGGGWGDTRLDLPSGTWRDVLTDRPADPALASLLDTLPVALLVKED